MTLSSSLNISSQGLSTHAARMKIYANNVANINTPNYVRKVPILAENYMMSFGETISKMRHGVIQTGVSYGPGGVTLAGVVGDPTPGKRIHQPGHPDADKDGYITTANVNVMADMSDAMKTTRVYEANLAVVTLVKTMANKALEIGRGG